MELNKEQQAIERLRFAAQMSEAYYDEKIQILIAYPEQYYKDENNHQVAPSFEEIKSSYEKDGYICED